MNLFKKDSQGTGSANGYRVILQDPAGCPVPGARVQCCSEAMCVMQETDAEGIACFDLEAGSYTVHVAAVPDGFEPDEREYPLPETVGDTVITIGQTRTGGQG